MVGRNSIRKQTNTLRRGGGGGGRGWGIRLAHSGNTISQVLAVGIFAGDKGLVPPFSPNNERTWI